MFKNNKSNDFICFRQYSSNNNSCVESDDFHVSTFRPLYCLILIAFLLFSSQLNAAPDEYSISSDEYQLGRGLDIPSLNLKIGGYLSTTVTDQKNENARFDLHDLSLFASWTPSQRWQLFTELELEKGITIDDQGITSSDAEVVLERLYADYTFTPWLSLRLGKQLTPVGRWNLIHADPLVWTVSRPIVTKLPFASSTTGISAHGTFLFKTNSLEYMVYLDDSKDLDPAPSKEDFELPGVSNIFDNDAFDNGAGIHFRYNFLDDKAEVGVSYSNFRMYGLHDRKQLVGIDGRLSWNRIELTTEAVYRHSQGSEKSEWGGFVQGVLPLISHTYIVARYEYYHNEISSKRTKRGVIGLAYRPKPPIIFKLEINNGNDEQLIPDGWQASFAILF